MNTNDCTVVLETDEKRERDIQQASMNRSTLRSIGEEHSERTLLVAICAHNERFNIGRLLENLVLEQHLPPSSRIVVACSGCTDGTSETVREWAQRDSRIEIIEERERTGKSSAVNLLLSRCNEDLILFVAADTIPAPGSIMALAKESDRSNVGLISACPIPIKDEPNMSLDRCLGSVVDLLWRLHNRNLSILSRNASLRHATGEMLLVKGGIVRHIPNRVVNDDAYMANEVRRKGYTVEFSTRAKVFIRVPTRVHEYVTQRRRVIYGHLQMARTCRHRPQCLDFAIFVNTRTALEVLTDEMRNNLCGTASLLLAAMLEAIAGFLALADVWLGSCHVPWKMIRTTKHALV